MIGCNKPLLPMNLYPYIYVIISNPVYYLKIGFFQLKLYLRDTQLQLADSETEYDGNIQHNLNSSKISTKFRHKFSGGESAPPPPPLRLGYVIGCECVCVCKQAYTVTIYYIRLRGNTSTDRGHVNSTS